jgi:hypothetical protein
MRLEKRCSINSIEHFIAHHQIPYIFHIFIFFDVQRKEKEKVQ